MFKSKNKSFTRFIAIFIILTFGLTNLGIQPVHAQIISNTGFTLPNPGSMIPLSPGYQSVLMKGLKLDPTNPLKFDFVIDPGDSGLQGQELQDEANKLIKYFLATLTVPNDKLWVNLSPYEQDRIIPDEFGATEMGRDLLAQDYLLKQITASMIYPEDELGKAFWDKIYTKTKEQFGTTDLPVNTFNKVWIIPDDALVYEEGNLAFVVQSHLKVMLEEDYLALDKNRNNEEFGTNQIFDQEVDDVSQVTSSIIREIIIPELEKEVNEGKNFANLRQIFNSMILATWYKENLKKSIINKIYSNQNKVEGIEVNDPAVKEKIYQSYLEAFKVGVYNYIKEDYDPITKEIIPRKYFSGGFLMDMTGSVAGKVRTTTNRSWRTLIGGAVGLFLLTVIMACSTTDPDTGKERTIPNYEQLQQLKDTEQTQTSGPAIYIPQSYFVNQLSSNQTDDPNENYFTWYTTVEPIWLAKPSRHNQVIGKNVDAVEVRIHPEQTQNLDQFNVGIEITLENYQTGEEYGFRTIRTVNAQEGVNTFTISLEDIISDPNMPKELRSNTWLQITKLSLSEGQSFYDTKNLNDNNNEKLADPKVEFRVFAKNDNNDENTITANTQALFDKLDQLVDEFRKNVGNEQDPGVLDDHVAEIELKLRNVVNDFMMMVSNENFSIFLDRFRDQITDFLLQSDREFKFTIDYNAEFWSAQRILVLHQVVDETKSESSEGPLTSYHVKQVTSSEKATIRKALGWSNDTQDFYVTYEDLIEIRLDRLEQSNTEEQEIDYPETILPEHKEWYAQFKQISNKLEEKIFAGMTRDQKKEVILEGVRLHESIHQIANRKRNFRNKDKTIDIENEENIADAQLIINFTHSLFGVQGIVERALRDLGEGKTLSNESEALAMLGSLSYGIGVEEKLAWLWEVANGNVDEKDIIKRTKEILPSLEERWFRENRIERFQQVDPWRVSVNDSDVEFQFSLAPEGRSTLNAPFVAGMTLGLSSLLQYFAGLNLTRQQTRRPRILTAETLKGEGSLWEELTRLSEGREPHEVYAMGNRDEVEQQVMDQLKDPRIKDDDLVYIALEIDRFETSVIHKAMIVKKSDFVNNVQKESFADSIIKNSNAKHVFFRAIDELKNKSLEYQDFYLYDYQGVDLRNKGFGTKIIKKINENVYRNFPGMLIEVTDATDTKAEEANWTSNRFAESFVFTYAWANSFNGRVPTQDELTWRDTRSPTEKQLEEFGFQLQGLFLMSKNLSSDNIAKAWVRGNQMVLLNRADGQLYLTTTGLTQWDENQARPVQLNELELMLTKTSLKGQGGLWEQLTALGKREPHVRAIVGDDIYKMTNAIQKSLDRDKSIQDDDLVSISIEYYEEMTKQTKHVHVIDRKSKLNNVEELRIIIRGTGSDRADRSMLERYVFYSSIFETPDKKIVEPKVLTIGIENDQLYSTDLRGKKFGTKVLQVNNVLMYSRYAGWYIEATDASEGQSSSRYLERSFPGIENRGEIKPGEYRFIGQVPEAAQALQLISNDVQDWTSAEEEGITKPSDRAGFTEYHDVAAVIANRLDEATIVVDKSDLQNTMLDQARDQGLVVREVQGVENNLTRWRIAQPSTSTPRSSTTQQAQRRGTRPSNVPPPQDQKLGGIDLNADNLNLRTQGEGIDFEMPDLEILETIPINGITPVIINITPATNLLLGLEEDADLPIAKIESHKQS